MTVTADIRVDTKRVRGSINPQIYGQFIEHIGRVIYGGVYEPGSPLADDSGSRTDVLEAVANLKPSILRWPGGNFASGYHWRDGIGPVDERPARHDLAWNAIESNHFGTEEFLAYCARVGAEPYLNLNASTGTVDEALAWLAYTNSNEALPEVQLRQKGPHPARHGVRIWGIGNENYGWWQHGHTTAEQYAETAREWGKLLRWADPDLQLIGVGASADPDWNWTVLKTAGRYIDHLSLHYYWHGGEDTYHATLAGPVSAERSVQEVWGMCLAAQSVLRLPRPVTLAVDEWNVWARTFQPAVQLSTEELMRQGFSSRSGFDTRFEEVFDLTDALAVASWLNVMWRHPEKVTLATQAQMVNAIAPILTSAAGSVRQTIFHPMAIARAHAGSVALDVQALCDKQVPGPGLVEGSMPIVDAAGTLDPSSGRVHLSIINRSRDEELTLRFEGCPATARAVTLWHEDVTASNTFENPDTVVPRTRDVDVSGGLVVPPHSHTTLLV